jgi:hypothetical protein
MPRLNILLFINNQQHADALPGICPVEPGQMVWYDDFSIQRLY